MPNLTTPIPSRLTGDVQTDVQALKKWGTALIDELTYIFNNLDAGNVSEAASVKAETSTPQTRKSPTPKSGT